MEQTLNESPLIFRIGRWWFQNRSLSPLPWVLLIAILPPQTVYSPIVLWAAGIVILVCEGIRIWAVGYAGSVTRTRGDTVPVLVHAGPYRYIRNPLYVANIGMYTATGVFFGFSSIAVGILLYSVVQYTFIVRFEEGILKGTFGPSYERFTSLVPRWFGFSPAIESSGHSFDLVKALISEKSTFFSMGLVTFVYLLKHFIAQS